MRYPYKKLVLPSVLHDQINGKLDKKLLKAITLKGEMLKVAADAFNALVKAAKAADIDLVNQGDYRSYDRQLAMFKDRFTLKDEGRVPQITRTFEGKTYYLKPGKSPCAAPDPTGKSGSNHGWGLAIDLAARNKEGQVISMGATKRVFPWLCANAPTYGFYLQGDNPDSPEWEAWHWQYCLGDTPAPYLAK